MRHRSPNKWQLPCLLLVLAISLVVSPSASHGQTTPVASPTPLSPDLQAARVALAKYSDPFAAVKDGYFSTLACIDLPMDGHEPIMPTSLRHYDLHVWLWKDNPRGLFTSTNAALKCTPDAAYTVAIGAAHHH